MEAILIAALTGFRWNEVFGLRVPDVNLRARTVTVRRGLTRSKGASVPGRAGSRKARPRTEAIPDWLAEMLAPASSDWRRLGAKRCCFLLQRRLCPLHELAQADVVASFGGSGTRKGGHAPGVSRPAAL